MIRAERAAEIERGVTAHLAGGGGAVFVTLTVPHVLSDRLAESLDALLAAWRWLASGRAWAVLRNQVGYVGYIRSVEVTRGAAGWHPHLHTLVLTDLPLSAAGFDAFRAGLVDRWCRAVERQGWARPRVAAQDVQRVDDRGHVLAAYVSKVQDGGTERCGSGWSAGAELARGDVKTARRWGSRTPFQLLDSDDPADRHAWVEFAQAARGRRAIVFSRGLRERLGLTERTDEQVIEDAEQGAPVWVPDQGTYARVRAEAPELIAVALEAIGRGDSRAVALIMGGRPWSPEDRVLDAWGGSWRRVSPECRPGPLGRGGGG